MVKNKLDGALYVNSYARNARKCLHGPAATTIAELASNQRAFKLVATMRNMEMKKRMMNKWKQKWCRLNRFVQVPILYF